MKILLLSAALLTSSLLLFSCKKDNPVIPPPDPIDLRKITLSEEGKSCSEIWVKILADSIQFPTIISLSLDNSEQELTLSRRDTVLYFDSLETSRGYKFGARLKSDSTIKSQELTIRTLTPTSHNFTYETYELGDPLSGYSSILYGASIIDENNIWVVGEIYEVDSSGNDIKYNAAHWDGNSWELKKILYQNNFWIIKAIYNLGKNDVWFSAFVRFDGADFYELPIPEVLTGWGINQIWGKSSNNLFVVGTDGNIANFNNGNWQSIPSPTTLTLTDIFSNGNGDIYAGSGSSASGEGVLLKGNEEGMFTIMVEGGIIDESQLFNPNLYGPLGAVWVDENNTIYSGGFYLYRYKNNSWNYVASLPGNYLGGIPSNYRGVISSIRGNNVNDCIIAGGRNTLQHFNGIDWEQLGFPYDPSSNIVWRDVQMKGNTAIAVGDKGSYAFIILLNR